MAASLLHAKRYYMRPLFTALCALCCSLLLSAEGIEFTKADWTSVLAQAKTENKIVFVDAYTTWCGPCKQMSARVFTQAEVGKHFNANFINVKMDMEGDVGRRLARQYRVMVYPTLLFVDGDGEVVHRSAGYQNAQQLISLSKAALDPAQQFAGLKRRFQQGDADPEFLYTYLQAAADALDPTAGPALEAYLDTQSDWATDANRALIFRFTEGLDSRLFQYLVKERQAFERQLGEEAVTRKIEYLLQQNLYNNPNVDPSQVAQALGRIYPGPKAERMTDRFKLDYYQRRGEPEKFASAGFAYVEKHGATDADLLNNIAWTIYESDVKKKTDKRALRLALQAVEMDGNYYNTDTVAALYTKLRKKGKAKAWIAKAIAQGKAEGEDTSETERLLERW